MNKLKSQKRRQIVTELKTNSALIKVCERVCYLLTQTKYTLTQQEVDNAVKVMNQTLFDEVLEERLTMNLCSNFKCASDALHPSQIFQPTLYLAKEKPKTRFCGNKACVQSYESIKTQVSEQETLVIENHMVLDQNVQCLLKYCDTLSDSDFADQLERSNLVRWVADYNKVMDKIRVTIQETKSEYSEPKPQTQQMWTIDTTVHQKKEEVKEGGKKVHFKEDTAVLEFEIQSENSEQSGESGDGFLFEDIAQELQFYKNQEMTTFQKVNMFFNQISNQQLQNYIQGTDQTYNVPQQSSEHRFFCQQVVPESDDGSVMQRDELVELLNRCEVVSVPAFRAEEWTLVRRIFRYLVGQTITNRYGIATEPIAMEESELILARFLM